MIIDYRKILILLAILFFGIVSVNANSAYKNELTRVSLSPVGSGDVKVTLYMAKPYSEPLRLLKKNDGEFVLILPETYTSAPQKPSISDVYGDVTDADVRLYSFVSNTNKNGYTKIVVKTNGLINLYPEAVTTGGGTMVNHPQQQVNKIISEQIKPSNQTTQAPKPENKISKTDAPIQIKVPEIKQKSDSKTEVSKNETLKKEQEKKEKAKAEVSKNETLKKELEKKEKTKTEEPKNEVKKEENAIPSAEVKTETSEAFDNIEEIQNLPQITTDEVLVEPVEIVEQTNPAVQKTFLQKVKNKLSGIKAIIAAHSPKGENLPNHAVNILVLLAALMLTAFSIKFAIAVLKNSGQKKESVPEPQKTADEGYSQFFKKLVESEISANPAETNKVLSSKRDYGGIEIEPAKSHKEVLNTDQNLSWQEKFRALQKNRRLLFKDENDVFTGNNEFPMENTENMENPIKKLTQDFRAVKKVLEKQSAKTIAESSIKQDFTPEKIEKIEIISFEDLQQKLQKPKVQINKTSPIKVKEPKILTRLKLKDNKGLYLVDYKDKISLLGYVKDKVFKLNSYASVKNPKLYARLTEQTNDTDTYIVKIDNSKLIVNVDEEKMKLKLMY